MYKIIACVISQPFDDYNYKRIDIERWIKEGWQVEVYDLTPWLYPSVWDHFTKNQKIIKNYEYYFPVHSKHQLICHYKKLRTFEYVLDFTEGGLREVLLSIKFKKDGVKRIVHSVGAIPYAFGRSAAQSNLLSSLSKINSYLKNISSRYSMRQAVEALIAKFLKYFFEADLVVIGGAKSIPKHINPSKIIKAHNFDYDIFLRIKNIPSLAIKEYAVFIDQNYCYHPDFIYRNECAPVTVNGYFKPLINFLVETSRELNVEIKIAAHPRSFNDEISRKAFEGFEVAYKKTAELVKDCKFIICHDSTAIQFAILFKKPIVFVITNELYLSIWRESIEMYAESVGKSVINLELSSASKIDWNKELIVDQDKYEVYKNMFIKTHLSPDLPLSEIVINYLSKSAP